MKILFAASECLPFIKTGGLADVVGTLPKALADDDTQVAVILPKYRLIAEEYRFNMRHVFDTYIGLGWRSQFLGVDELVRDGVTYWFVDNEFYFGGDRVYGDGEFETERFCFFCKAVMEALPRLGFIPDVLHCNDWQTGYLPLLCSQYRRMPDYRGIKTVFTVHNLKFQGISSRALVEDLLGLGQAELDRVEYGGGASAMKAGLMYANRITTVSPTYSREILTPEFGETMDVVLRDRQGDLSGILNGIDRKLFDPWRDKCIASRFSKNALQGKAKCKLALQRELGFAEDDAPIFAVISRLTLQKGVDLIADVIPGIIDNGGKVVVLGMGEARFVDAFGGYERRYPGSFAFRCEMNDSLSRRIYAGSDIFLMPSRFEPCGLSQLLALRYGCVPIVRETGGLADTVTPYNRFEDSGNGFSFHGCTADELWSVVALALELYYKDRQAWQRLVSRGMACDFGWARSAETYKELYSALC